MPRPNRLECHEACYHVSSFGISQLSVFETQSDADTFLVLLDDVHRMFEAVIYAYVLMREGYHLIIQTPLGNLSSIMRYINSVYSQRYNRSKCRKGPLFCGRYKSILINSDMYLIQVSRYIHWLPVEFGYCRRPGEYCWSSCQSYYGKTAMPVWLSHQSILNRFGEISNFRIYTEQGVDEEMLEFYGNKHAGPVLGSKSFKKQLQLHCYMPKSRIPNSTEKILHRISIPDIMEHVEGCHANCSNNSGTNDNTSRNIAMALCREVGGHSLKDIADAFKLGHHRSVSVIVSRLKKRIDTDKRLAVYYHSLRDQLLLGTVDC